MQTDTAFDTADIDTLVALADDVLALIRDSAQAIAARDTDRLLRSLERERTLLPQFLDKLEVYRTSAAAHKHHTAVVPPPLTERLSSLGEASRARRRQLARQAHYIQSIRRLFAADGDAEGSGMYSAAGWQQSPGTASLRGRRVDQAS